MTQPKRQFIVAYDYGMGGLWGVVAATSAEAIYTRYPELTLVEDWPDWMDAAERGRLSDSAVDLDESPRGILLGVVADR